MGPEGPGAGAPQIEEGRSSFTNSPPAGGTELRTPRGRSDGVCKGGRKKDRMREEEATGGGQPRLELPAALGGGGPNTAAAGVAMLQGATLGRRRAACEEQGGGAGAALGRGEETRGGPSSINILAQPHRFFFKRPERSDGVKRLQVVRAICLDYVRAV